MASTQGSAFAYHEPSIKTVLNYTGFLLTLNIVNTCLDQLLYCGLIGQLFIGVLWGTPGAQWFDQETERVIQQIGYLGLILLIYEGKCLDYCPPSWIYYLIINRWSVNLDQVFEGKHPSYDSRCHHWNLCSNGLVIHSQGNRICNISSVLCSRRSLECN